MRVIGHVSLSRWILLLVALCLAQAPELLSRNPPEEKSEGGRRMEMRTIEWPSPTGGGVDAHTRVVAPSGVPPGRTRHTTNGQRRIAAPTHATFQITDWSGRELSAEARVAFDYAVGIWAQLINSPVPIEITVGTGTNPGFLSDGTIPVYRNFPNAPVADVWYPKPLANAIAGVDVQPGVGEISIRFSTQVNWYFGTDGRTPAGKYDFVTVALREIGQQFGFWSFMFGSSGWGQWGVQGSPMIYATFLVNGSGQSLLNTSLFPNPSLALGSQLSSNNIFWSGPKAMAALGGARPKIYTPNPWVDGEGASLLHLDEATYPPGNANSLMTPVLNTGEAIHVPGPAMMGMLADMGWAQDTACSYVLDDAEVLVERDGIAGAIVNVLAPPQCSWTAVSDSSFITVTGSAGNGPSPIAFSVSANAGVYRTGTITIGGQTFTVRQNGHAPTMTVDKTALRFGAASLGASFMTQTPTQVVRLRQSGLPGTVTWTAQSTQPWLQVNPTSGTGSADLSISVISAAGVPLQGSVSDSIQLTFTGAGNLAGPIAVTLTTVQNGLTTPPFGVVDTPADLQDGVTGAIAMTGWALDDIEVDRVAICRLPLDFEPVSFNPQCGNHNQVFLGFAVRVDGARPDVQSSYAAYPLNTKGGWGFMVLTNMLPLGGNGFYSFLAWAHDREGNAIRIGARTIICNNNAATKPFGAIDTPEQGGTASGSGYINFGWALTPQPKTIPVDGSTITVLVDGTPVGNASYNHFRSDIATLFPGRVNTNGAIGYRIIDTTLLDNGVHTISWIVSDDQGATEGIGSRFFTVSNGASALTSAATANAHVVDAPAVAAAPADRTGIVGRRGFDLSAPWIAYGADEQGRSVIRGEELDRFELALGRGTGEQHTGFLRVGDRLTPLPAGSRLDASTGAFTWAPGVGFVGTYDLVFLQSRQDLVVSRQDVRVILHARGSGRVGPQITIDAPGWQQDVAQPFAIGGWAIDPDASTGTGIGAVHVWAYPLTGGPPIFLGGAATGGARPDVAAIHGERFQSSGFGLAVQGLPHGNYDLAVFAWSHEKGDFAPAKVVRVTVR